MEIIQTNDGFLWGDVTDKAIEIWDANIFPLYALHSDNTESLIETKSELIEMWTLGVRIVFEIGYVYSKLKSKTDWESVDKKVIDGFMYVKANDVLFNEQ